MLYEEVWLILKSIVALLSLILQKALRLWIISAAHPRKVSGSLGKVELSNLSLLWHHQYSSDVLFCGTWNTAMRTPKVPRRSYIPHLMTWWGGNLWPLDKITRVKPCSEILHKKRHWLSVPIPSRLYKKTSLTFLPNFSPLFQLLTHSQTLLRNLSATHTDQGIR